MQAVVSACFRCVLHWNIVIASRINAVAIVHLYGHKNFHYAELDARNAAVRKKIRHKQSLKL